MNIAVCDDEISVLNNETEMICDILDERAASYIIKKFNSAQSLLDSHETYDIVFLDIEMDKMSGIELAKKILEMNKNCFVFFITNHSVYLDKAFDIRAFRFLSKPLDRRRLSTGIDSALKKIEDKYKKLSVTNYNNKLSTEIEISSVIYIENTGRHTKIVSSHCEFIAKELFSELKNQIEQEVKYFAMPHQSYYVNLRYVTNYTKIKVSLSYADKTHEIIMARRRYNDFDKKFFKMAGEIR